MHTLLHCVNLRVHISMVYQRDQSTLTVNITKIIKMQILPKHNVLPLLYLLVHQI